ncbi:MAG: HlyD family efflux transporter periplasmic adaptor subunit, partial [Planctomycetota bacterium]
KDGTASAICGPARRGGVLVKLTVAVAVLAGAGVGAWQLGLLGGDGEASERVQTADIAPVSIMSFDITTTASGELQAENQIEVRSKLERRTTIVELIEEGTRVAEGEVLAVLDADEYRTELDDEEIGLESDRAELIAAENAFEIQKSDNESSKQAAELKLRLAELALEQWVNGTHEIKMKELRLAIEEADRELERLQEKHEKNAELLAQGFISADQYKQDELAYIKAQSQVEKARLQHESYVNYQQASDREQKESDVEQARAELERVERRNKIQLADKQADFTSRQRRVSRRENEIKELKEQIEAATVRAPSAGMVVYGSTVELSRRSWSSEGPMQIGQQVYRNQLLFGLPDVSKLVAEVRVHERLAGRVQPGQKALITVDAANGRTVEGTVKEIGILAENGGWRDPNLREYTVKITIDDDNDDRSLKPSMRCEATLVLGRVEDSLAAPVPAVFSDGPVRYVYSPSGSGSLFRRVPVQTGRFSDTHAEIVAGLEVGQQVLLREPSAGEIIDEPWEQSELELVGLTLSEEGEPVRMEAEQAGVATPAAFRGG